MRKYIAVRGENAVNDSEIRHSSGGCRLVGGGSLPDAEIATTGYRHLPNDDAIYAAHHVDARHACKRGRASSDVPVSDMPNRGRDSAWKPNRSCMCATVSALQNGWYRQYIRAASGSKFTKVVHPSQLGHTETPFARVPSCSSGNLNAPDAKTFAVTCFGVDSSLGCNFCG